MFENERILNQVQVGYLQKVAADIPADVWCQDGAGHGHCPAWIVGHLGLIGEFGQKLLGGDLQHPEWLPLLGPGSSGKLEARPEFERDLQLQHLVQAYDELRKLAEHATPQQVARPHGIEIFSNSPIATVGHAVALMLTNHFGFHLAQLSSCRREQGMPAIF